MEQTNFLFIGGGADGHWRQIPNPRLEWQVAVPVRLDFMWNGTTETPQTPRVTDLAYKTECYEIHRFREADGTDVAAYVFRGHKGGVIRTLMEGYRKPVEKEEFA